MSTLNIEFMDDSMGFYSKVEDDLELSVLKAIQAKTTENVSNDIFSQISSLRHNLFKWYPFKKDCTILEISAGMGALTGLFCERAAKVVAIEKKMSRAEIIKKRLVDFDNLQVINDNIFNLNFSQKFDYIIIGDTFNYAKKYIKSDNSQQALLEKIKTFLKQDGVILLATENRLGLKYFSGAVENYSHKFFTGLNDFDGYDIIHTFSKSELISISTNSGLPYIRFYYPYPDHIFPFEIYTDRCLEQGDVSFGAKLPDYDIETERFKFFDEQKMFESLQKENVVTTFANSFLIEMSMTELDNVPISYVNMTDTLHELEQRYYPKYFPNFIYPVDVVDFGDIVSEDLNKKYNSQESTTQEKEILDLIRVQDAYKTTVDKKIVDFIDIRMRDCEIKYNIKVLFWAGRGSIVSGIFRKNSDLDLIVVYKSLGKKVASLHDIIGYGFDFWGWDIEDALSVIPDNAVLSKEHLRAGLDYYYGLYCAFGSYFVKDYDNFFKKTQDIFMKAYQPKNCVKLFLPMIESIYNELLKNGKLSYADYLNVVEYILCSIHFLKNEMPGDVHIRKLAEKYLTPQLQHEIYHMLNSYMTSLKKHSQLTSVASLNEYIKVQLELINSKLETLEDTMKNTDILDIINELKDIIAV